MKLYVCWGTFAPDNHPCGQAHRALVEAGHDPEVVRAYGWGRLPEEVGYVSVYSKRDGVVDWHSCLDPAADHVEIRASHCGMAVSRGAFGAVAEALDTFRRQDARGTKKRSRPRAVRGAARRAA